MNAKRDVTSDIISDGAPEHPYVRGDAAARDRATRTVRMMTGVGAMGAAIGTALLTVGLVGGSSAASKASSTTVTTSGTSSTSSKSSSGTTGSVPPSLTAPASAAGTT